MIATPYSELLEQVSDDVGWKRDETGALPIPDASEWLAARRAFTRAIGGLWDLAFWRDLLVTEQRAYRLPFDADEVVTAGAERWFAPSGKYYLALNSGAIGAPAQYLAGSWQDTNPFWVPCAGAYTGVEDWDATVTYAAGRRVRDPDDGVLYQAFAENTNQEPPNALYWGELVAFQPYVLKRQVGQREIGRVEGVYLQDPRVYPGAAPVLHADGGSDVRILEQEPTLVWVRFLPPAPRFLGTFWDAGAYYTPVVEYEQQGVPTIPEVNPFKWFTDIDEMLAFPSTEWTQARTINSYGTDGITSSWDRILKTNTLAAGLADNGDTVRETDDGLSFALVANRAP